jgi:glycosyltransferase involved in cell wall biosynthesis
MNNPSDKTDLFNEELNEAQPTLSVIIPAYNEGRSIGLMLDSLLPLASAHGWELIVVDDGSTDQTAAEVIRRKKGNYLKLINHPYNRGYGAALKSGIRLSTAPFVATMDSDGQHDPLDLLKLLPSTATYSLVVGQRTELLHSPLWRMPGKWFLSWLANYLTGFKIPDLNSGMRIFKTEAIKKYLHLCPDGFSFSTTSTIAFFNQGYAVKYVPITIRQREKLAKSTVNISTGFNTLVLILRLASLFQPLRVFIPISFLFGLIGFLWGLPFVLLQRGVSVAALLFLLTGLLLFCFGLLADQVAQLRLEKYE